MEEKDLKETFLYKNGNTIVLQVFLISLIISIILSIYYFINGIWLFGIWAFFSIFMIPKATLGLILIIGRKDIIAYNLSPSVYRLYSGTIARYRNISSLYGNSVLMGFIRESLWLGVALTPLIYFLVKIITK